MTKSLGALQRQVVSCTRCPRLVEWRRTVAAERTRRFESERYWGKPVPGFGDPHARLLLVGLAPAAHGGNRTGRMFTGDRSGDWLYEALHKFGFANMPTSTSIDDGLTLKDCYVTAACRCAPPQNKPLPSEIAHCRPFLISELQLLKNIRVVVGLGKIGFTAAFKALGEAGRIPPDPVPSFSHGVEYTFSSITLLGSFHPSQQNTFTGRLTRPMFHSIFRKARTIMGKGKE